MAGLLQVPNARMFSPGKVFAGVTEVEPYTHAFIGAQPLSFLTIIVRQSVGLESESLFTPLHPGLDFKLRLVPESRWLPEIAVGAQGVAGSARLSSEYLVFNKRHEDFDFTLGIGWGRLGSKLGRHRIDAASGPDTWFAGRFSFFGGVEYATPIEGLSLKLEYAPDRFSQERRDDAGVKRGLPINAGIAYRPFRWLELAAGFERGKEIMLRAALSAELPRLATGEPDNGARPALRPRPSHGAREERVVDDVRSRGYRAERLEIVGDKATLFVSPRDREPLAQLIGRSLLVMSNRLPPAVEQLQVVAARRGLEGVSLQIYRSDLERAMAHRGSPEEIWRNAEVGPAPVERPDEPSDSFLPRVSVTLTPRLEVSFYEQEQAIVQRSSLLLSVETERRTGLVGGAAVRANLSDNLPDFQLRQFLETGILPLYPVRSDVQAFATQPFALERFYTGVLWSPSPDWHTRLSSGYFEEMYAGLSGEFLYRPMTARWALGLDVNYLFKRLPGTLTGLSGDQVLTGHVNMFYEVPWWDLTASLHAGRYLGGDWGATIELDHRFSNGIRLGAFATWTNGIDRGYGVRSGQFDQGLMVSIPLDGLPLVPRGSQAESIVRPLGRDEGQRAEIPLRLYDVTNPISYRELARTWNRLLD